MKRGQCGREQKAQMVHVPGVGDSGRKLAGNQAG